MKKNKNIFGIAILLILIITFNFILAQEDEVYSYDSENVQSKTESEYGEQVTTLSFIDEGGFVEINGVKFENVLPKSESLSPSFIKIDSQGNILQADLTANEKGSSFLINGLTFEAPPNSRVYYDKDGGFYLQDVKVSGIEKDKFPDQNFNGKNVNFLDELILKDGSVRLNKDGSYFLNYGDYIYENLKISEVSSFGGLTIIKDPLRDLSDYNENFIQKTESGLKVRSREFTYANDVGINLEFLEGNKIFNFNDEGLGANQNRFLKMEISDGDGVELINQRGFIPGQIIHKTSEKGKTIIENGRHIFKFEKGKLITELGDLNSRNLFSIKSSVSSDLLGAKRISIDNNNGYQIFNPLGEGAFTFDKSLLADPTYNFKSDVGEKLYSFSEGEIGDSAFVFGGRGRVYYDEETGKQQVPIPEIKAYDCIGLAQCGLVKTYSGTSFNDFPPNLQLIEALENRGWESKVIEPTKVVGEASAEDSVKKIPPGSIVFLMHDEYPEKIKDLKEGISYQTYKNSKGEKKYLAVGHTLIKGIGNNNFINAHPSGEKELPKSAREYNEMLKRKGEDPLFIGTVREGKMVPENDYLVVISPPEN